MIHNHGLWRLNLRSLLTAGKGLLPGDEETDLLQVLLDEKNVGKSIDLGKYLNSK
jgi:hypothetical protein